MTPKEQTALQWLKSQLAVTHSPEIIEWLWAKALQMEREQIEQAWDLGRRDIDYPANGSQYFTETYQSNK